MFFFLENKIILCIIVQITKLGIILKRYQLRRVSYLLLVIFSYGRDVNIEAILSSNILDLLEGQKSF